jgi:hypothetical protein
MWDRQRARLHPDDANVLAGQEHPEVVRVAGEHDAVGGAMAFEPRDRSRRHEGVDGGAGTRRAEQPARLPGGLDII